MPIIDLTHRSEEQEQLIEQITEKSNAFLKENGWSNIVFFLTLECERCKVLCVMDEEDIPFYECPQCHHRWQIKALPEDINKK